MEQSTTAMAVKPHRGLSPSEVGAYVRFDRRREDETLRRIQRHSPNAIDD